jgi:hypothetical protein
VRLTINGEQVSYSLESEQNLADVVRGVQEWLAGAGFLVTEMRAVGGTSVSGASGADVQDLLQTPLDHWGGKPVGSVRELEVIATHTGELKIDHWRTVDAWLGMLAEGITGDAASGLEDLLADLPDTMGGLRTNPFMPQGSDAVERFDSLFHAQGNGAHASIRAWPPERVREAIALIDELRQGVQARIADATQPRTALARCVAQVRDSLTRLPEVSVLLQTGRDKEGMNVVIGFADTVQSILGLMPFLPPDPERGKLIVELTPFLRDLVGAFGAKDSVLIGDLLEYEITPRMERLAPLLEKAL